MSREKAMKSHTGRLVVLFALLLLPSFAMSSETPGDSAGIDAAGWDLAADLGLQQSQSAYSNNWEGDEAGTMTWRAIINASALRTFSPRLSNRSTLKLEYGQTQTQDREQQTWTGPTKSADLIDFESVFTLNFNRGLGPFIAGRYLSQFTDYRNERELYFNPMQFNESAGLSRTFIKEKNRYLASRLGAAIRQRWDRNYSLSDTTNEWSEEKVHDAGIEFVSEISTPMLAERVRLDARLSLFQALYNSDAIEDGDDSWKMVDVDLQADFATRITKLIMVNLRVRFLYDEELSKAGRFKETLSLGMTYSIL
jgi:hypothetical protein